jgi:signal transduction histidine kinase/CheY-like chemotaxis protein
MKTDDVFALENAGWPAFLTNASGLILRANPSAIQIFGPVVGNQSVGFGTLWPPGNSHTIEQFLTAGKQGTGALLALKLISSNGDHAAWLASISAMDPEHFLIQLFPERRSASVEPRGTAGDSVQAQKQKLDCALQLARTVSLDFNNALTSILGHASLILSKVELEHPWRQALLEIEKSAARAAEVSNDLASFSRQEKDGRGQATGNLNSVLRRCVEFFQRNPGPQGVDWKLQLERNLFTCKFDSLKLQQAFLRVIENSMQAFERPGRIVVLSRNVELNGASQDRNVKLAPGAHVCVEISDNGAGIEPDVLPKIFEPFFTTKRDKKHRGLGLAWVYGIVTNHGGGVAVSSQPGQGTSVRIYLPAGKSFITEAAVSSENLNGSQTILIVDDEELILTMGNSILSEHGYKVLTAESGQQALDLLEATEPIDLVLTDLVMPAMSGRELIDKIQKSFPSTRIVCMSGYPWPAPQINHLPFIQKPFSAQELLLKFKAVFSG